MSSTLRDDAPADLTEAAVDGGWRRTVDRPLSQSVTELVLDDESGRCEADSADKFTLVNMWPARPLQLLAGPPSSLAGELLLSCDASEWRELYMERIRDWCASVSDIRSDGTGVPFSPPADAAARSAKHVAAPRWPKSIEERAPKQLGQHFTWTMELTKCNQTLYTLHENSYEKKQEEPKF